MKNIKIGIVIPYYENSKEMKDQFEYLLDILTPQIETDVKLVVVVNGKEAKWIEKYSNTTIIYEKNPNVSKARNIGISFLIKNSEYIMFLDADDSISCDYIKKALEVTKNKEYDIIDSRFIWNGYEVWGTRELRNKQIKAFRGSVTGTMYSSEIIGETLFDETIQIGEDVKFNKEILNKSPKKGLFDGIYVYNKGVNPNSLVMRYERGEIGENINQSLD